MTAENPPIPVTDPEVKKILGDLRGAIQAILGERLIGMYLYGSLALGDFNPSSSDIDFLAVTADDISREELAALQAMHARLAAGGSKWALELEGSYIPAAALRRYNPPDIYHPHIDRGSAALQIERHDTDWVVQRYSLREYGKILAGPPVATLIDPISPDDLRQGVLGLLWWWEEQLRDTHRVATSAYQAYTILSMCRIRYTLRSGAIFSKPAAARWALQTLDAHWAGLIERALAWQPGQAMDHLDETLAFIRETLAESCQQEACMHIEIYKTAGDFLGAAKEALEANEAANSLMFGLALRAQRHPERIKIPHFYATVHLDGALQAAALMTPPNNLIVFSAAVQPSAQAFRLLAGHLRQHNIPVPGVLGPNAAALAFAEAWQAATGETYRLTVHERIYELRQVVPAPPTAGQMRLAGPQDLDLIARWLVAFHLEAVLDNVPSLDEAVEIAGVRIKDQSFYLWDDGQPVALAGWTRPTPHGSCIGPVYTPPEFRRKGYASALTAALSQVILDSGKQFVTLFTDLANPTSNSIYQKIGYRRVCEFDQYRFEQ